MAVAIKAIGTAYAGSTRQRHARRVTRNLLHLPAKVTRMTSTSPAPAPALAPPVPGGAGGDDCTGKVDARGTISGMVFYLAHCHRCAVDDFSEPFASEIERDTWAVEHLVNECHTVHLSIDGRDAQHHCSGMLRFTDMGNGFEWLCSSAACRSWVGPYVTAQLALADWRHHDGPVR